MMEANYNKILEVKVPEGLRAGKYLQKQIQKEGLENINLPSLVEGLDKKYQFLYAESRQDWYDALEDCHSCQSDFSAQYYTVWAQLGIQLVTLFEGCEIVGRCLINEEEGTMAKCYGPKHYILQARLEFAGFSEGVLKDEIDIIEILEVLHPKDESHETDFSETPPKSKVYLKNEVLSDQSEIIEAYKIENWDVPHIVKKRQKRYLKACKEQNCKVGDPLIVEVKTVRPISDEWRWCEKGRTTIETNFYLDAVRDFIWLSAKMKAGWYKRFYPEVGDWGYEVIDGQDVYDRIGL